MAGFSRFLQRRPVRPHARAGVEITPLRYCPKPRAFALMRGRELKFSSLSAGVSGKSFALMRGRELKSCVCNLIRIATCSPSCEGGS